MTSVFLGLKISFEIIFVLLLVFFEISEVGSKTRLFPSRFFNSFEALITLFFISLLPFWLPTANISQFAVHSSYHIGVFYMAVISGSIAFYLSNKAQKSIEIGEQALFGYMYPIFSAPLAVIWLGEKITPIFILGAITIATGVFIAEVKKKRYNSSS